ASARKAKGLPRKAGGGGCASVIAIRPKRDWVWRGCLAGEGVILFTGSSPGRKRSSKEETHGRRDQGALHRARDFDRGSQRTYPFGRRNRGPRSLGAEGDGRPGQAEYRHARAPVRLGYAACFGGALDFVA